MISIGPIFVSLNVRLGAYSVEKKRTMKIACKIAAACTQVLDVLRRHGVTRALSWEGGSPLDTRNWIIVWAAIDPAVKAAIRRDIDSIAGVTVQE